MIFLSGISTTYFNMRTTILAVLLLVSGSLTVSADSLRAGWNIDPEASEITFSSVKFEKGERIAETHSFATFTGSIDEAGEAKITVTMDSVDTQNDLRNVRMRFLFFESFKYPEGVVTLKLTEDMVQGLAVGSQKVVSVPFNLKIKDVSNRLEASVLISVIDENTFSAKSNEPIIFFVEQFGLGNDLRKIAETAGGFDIVPQMELNFDFAFNRKVGGAPPVQVAEEQQPTEPAALETQGDFSLEECVGRFEILSETGNIYFSSGSARLKEESFFVLRTILDIVQRCPGLRILVSGHTDSDGSEVYNQSLSEERARSVQRYLIGQGVNSFRLVTTGHGELRPMVPNDSDFNKSRNRRIEFSLYR